MRASTGHIYHLPLPGLSTSAAPRTPDFPTYLLIFHSLRSNDLVRRTTISILRPHLPSILYSMSQSPIVYKYVPFRSTVDDNKTAYTLALVSSVFFIFN